MAALWTVSVVLLALVVLLMWAAGALLLAQRAELLMWVVPPARPVGWAVLLSAAAAALVEGLPVEARGRRAFDTAFVVGVGMLGTSVVLAVGGWVACAGWLWLSPVSLAYLCLHSLAAGMVGCALVVVGAWGARRG